VQTQGQGQGQGGASALNPVTPTRGSLSTYTPVWMEGYMAKEGASKGIMSSDTWTRRYFVLKVPCHAMQCYAGTGQGRGREEAF
jgi:hypothetical protein